MFDDRGIRRPEMGYFGLSSASSANISTARQSLSWYQAAVKGASSCHRPWQSREYIPRLNQDGGCHHTMVVLHGFTISNRDVK